jgi:hypothetical protein
MNSSCVHAARTRIHLSCRFSYAYPHSHGAYDAFVQMCSWIKSCYPRLCIMVKTATNQLTHAHVCQEWALRIRITYRPSRRWNSWYIYESTNCDLKSWVQCGNTYVHPNPVWWSSLSDFWAKNLVPLNHNGHSASSFPAASCAAVAPERKHGYIPIVGKHFLQEYRSKYIQGHLYALGGKRENAQQYLQLYSIQYRGMSLAWPLTDAHFTAQCSLQASVHSLQMQRPAHVIITHDLYPGFRQVTVKISHGAFTHSLPTIHVLLQHSCTV